MWESNKVWIGQAKWKHCLLQMVFASFDAKNSIELERAKLHGEYARNSLIEINKEM